MSQQLITKINGADIVTVDRDGETFVPIKPICQALGISANVQREKIEEDETLNSVALLSSATGSDGKTYEMFCLPLKYVFGWLFTINPKNVALEAREAVTNYRRQCYDVLYEHFTGNIRKTNELNEAELALINEYNAALADEKEARSRRKRAEESIEQIRSERLNPQQTLF